MEIFSEVVGWTHLAQVTVLVKSRFEHGDESSGSRKREVF